MNEFDPLDFSGGAAKRDTNGAPIDPMEAAARQVMGERDSTVRANLYSVVNTPADTAARHQRLARETGVPADVVSRNEADVTRTAYLNDIDRALADSPTLAARLASPEFAALAHDDLEDLGLFERVTRQITGGAIEAPGMMASGTGHFLDALQRGATGWASLLLPEPMAGGAPTLESLAGPMIGEGWRQSGGAVKGFARDTVMIPEAQRTFGDQVLGGLGQVAGQIITAPLTGGASLYAQGVDVMAEKIAKDAPTPYDDIAMLLGGVVTGATEKWALDKLLGPLAVPIKNKVGAALTRIGIASVSEGGQEALENTLHDVIRKGLVNRDAPIELGQSLEEGGVGAAVGGIVRSIVEAGLHVRMRGARAEHQAKIAEDGATLMEGINKLAAASKVLARDSATLESFIEDSIEEDAPTQDLYVDGRLLMQSDTGEVSELGAALAEVSPAVAEQLADAAARGGAVRIPIAEYTAHIANTDLAGQLLDHVRVGEHEFSRAEARQYMQDAPAELEAQLEAQIQKAQNVEQARESVSAVRQDVAARLEGTGRYSKPVTDVYTALVGSFYETTGQRLGRTAEQIYADYPLQLGVQDAAGRRTLAQVAQAHQVEFEGFKTGQAVTFDFAHNTDSATKHFGLPKKGDAHGRDKEPSGRYVQSVSDAAQVDTSGTMTAGNLTLQSPLVLDAAGWKDALQAHYGKNGKALSLALLADGYDGVVTVVKDDRPGRSHVSEIVDLTTFDEAKALYQTDTPALPDTIDIDGVTRPTMNADGRPLHPTAEGVRNFWRWFGDSKVVDEAGRPIVMYHGTAGDFDEFSKAATPKHIPLPGFFFTPDPAYANRFAENAGEEARDSEGYLISVGGNVMPVYLALRNPEDVDVAAGVGSGNVPASAINEVIRDASKADRDGVILRGWKDGSGPVQYAVFDPEQIKSAVGNTGDFDPAKRNILHQATPGDLVITHNLTAANLLHAKKMGGIPVPSLAVTKADEPLDNFGEITLMGSKAMADPRGYASTKVFGSDIYSPRYPSVEFFVSPADRKRAEKELQPAEDATGSAVDWGEVQREGVRYLRDAPAIRWLFLESQGITPQSVKQEAPTLAPELAPFADDQRHAFDLANDPTFIDAVIAQQERELAPLNASDEAAKGIALEMKQLRENPAQLRRLAINAAQGIESYQRLARSAGQVDQYATRRVLRDLVGTNDLDGALERFAENYLSELDPTEKIFQGFTNAGKRRYSAHTLDNVVKILRKELRGGEGFDYGSGSLRAHFTPQFKSIEQIRKSKDRLMSDKAFETVAQEVDGDLIDLAESFGPDVRLDTVTAILADVPKVGLERSAAEFNVELSDDTKQRAVEFLTRLRDLPTAYFEAKILRAVDLAEFSGAVVPDDASPEVLAALAERGVKDVRTYKHGDSADRAAKIRSFQNLLFQKQGGKPRGTFDIDSRVITLLAGADLSTFLHESGHFFLEIQTDIASRLRGEASAFGADSLSDGERQYLADTDAVMNWFGVRDLETWHAMSFEEKTSYHEQFARGFEAYLFEGKAPSLELAGVFGRMRSWLLRIYKQLKNLNVELTPEVRQVFDRMLATDEAIETAEQARSMMPLFESAEGAGGAIEDYAAYQALGDEPTEDAKADLSARGLRDMKWLANARGRELNRLQKEGEALRNAKMIDVRAQVMSQPVYRAWQFLTAKLGPDDKIAAAKAAKSAPGVLDETVDDLFVAIAKLGGVNKDEAIGTWGVDPADKPGMPVFGKPVWRRGDGGMSLDGMAEALGQYGYLERDANGKVDLAAFEAAFKAQLSGEPVYSSAVDYTAARQVQPGDQVANPAGLSAGRLDLASLDFMDVDPDTLARVKGYKMTAKNGLHPDMVAALITDAEGNPEFDSGDALLNALAAADPPQVEIEALTDTAMLEEYGELSSPDALERAADAAIHNAARARFITTEANAVAAATGQPRILMRAVREYAAKAIARQRVRNLKPYQYTQAEGRAGKAAQDASRAGDLAKAAAEKRNQVLNNALAREALRARDEVERAQKYLAKFDTKAGRHNIPADYMDQITALRAPFDLKKGTTLKEADRRASLVQWVEAMKARNREVNIDADMLEKASLIAYRDLTMEQLRGLVEAVKTIEHMGRFKDELLRAQDAREFAEIEDDLEASIRANGGKALPVNIEPEDSLISKFMAQNRKFSSLVRQMDGGEDNGPMYRYLVRGMNDAGTQVAVMNEQATEALDKLYAPILKLKGGTAGDLREIPEAGVSLTRGGRLAVALNSGNETNAKRLTTSDWGKGRWNQSQVEAILKTLTRTEWEYVNGVWAFIDTYWPEIAAKSRRLTGVAPEKVEARPFTRTLADGTQIHLRGGYYPIKYDPTKDSKAASHDAAQEAKDMLRGAFTAATTRRGHEIQRVEDVGRPLFLSLDVIERHVIQVTNDLAWHEWLIDANRIMRSPRVTAAIRDHYGDDVLKTMAETLPAIAGGDLQRMSAGQKILMWARGNVSRATMGWSMTTALMQPFGLLQSVERIGAKHVLRGMLQWGGDAAKFENSMTAIAQKSDFMRLRNKTFNRELYEIKGRVKQGQSRARQVYDASIFMLMQKMQLVADVPTWLGAYEKALDEGHHDADAVAQADRAVIESQGGGQTKDLTEWQRKNPMLSMFFSYFSVTYNRMAESTAATDFKNPLAIAGWMSDMALLAIIPALGPSLLLALLRGEGDDDEPEDWALKLAKWQASYLMGTVPIVREFSGMIEGFDYGGPPAGRIVNDVGKVGTQLAQGDADEGLAIALIRTMGTLLGLPVTQLVRSYKGWKAWEDDDAPGTAILVGPPRK